MLTKGGRLVLETATNVGKPPTGARGEISANLSSNDGPKIWSTLAIIILHAVVASRFRSDPNLNGDEDQIEDSYFISRLLSLGQVPRGSNVEGPLVGSPR